MAEPKGRILVVDPEPASLSELSELMESLGNQVVTARTGDDGLRTFWDFLPDVAFVDLPNLGESGERMCRELKRTDYGVITPLVVYSQRHPTLNRVEVMRLYGAVDYILKPAQQSKIQALIEWVLSSRADSSQPILLDQLERFSLVPGSEGAVSLESGSLPYLLGRAEEEKLSGLLLMIAGGHKNILVFEQGLIVGASSNAPAEQIERVLLSMRKLTPAQLAGVKDKAQNGAELLPLLGFLGILRGEERREVLRYQALTIGLSMFRVPSGLLQFRHGESIDCPRLEAGIRPTTLALIGLRRNAALLRTATERFVRDPVVFLLPSASSRQASRSLPLTKFERTVLNAVDGERSVRGLRELGRLAQIDLDEPLAVLVGSGILKPSSAQPAGTGSERTEPATQLASGTPAAGSLEKRPFLELVGSLLREGATGLLTVEGVATRSFAFLDREIVHARSSRPEDNLGRLLVAQRVISREALDRALALQRQVPDRRLGSLLVEMHALSPDALYAGLRTQILRIFEDTFSWHFGTFHFVPNERPAEWSVRLDTEPITLLRQGTQRMSHKQLRGRWSRQARLVAAGLGADAAPLTTTEGELLAEASKPGGVELSTRDIGALRRAHLLVAAGLAHVVGEPEPEVAAAPGGERHPGDGRFLAADPHPAVAATSPTRGATMDHGRAGDVHVDILASAEPPHPDPHGANSIGAVLALLKEEILGEKHALDARLRWAEAELRQTMEELGRLRERTRHLEAENQALRERPGQADAATGQPPAPALASSSEAAPAPVIPQPVTIAAEALAESAAPMVAAGAAAGLGAGSKRTASKTVRRKAARTQGAAAVAASRRPGKRRGAETPPVDDPPEAAAVVARPQQERIEREGDDPDAGESSPAARSGVLPAVPAGKT